MTHPFQRPLDLGWINGAPTYPFNLTFPVMAGTPFSPDGTAQVVPPGPNNPAPTVSLITPQPLPNSSGLVLSNVVSFNVRVLSYDLRPNPDYRGNRIPHNKGLRFELYANLDTAHSDLLSGNLDVLDTIPPSALASATGAVELRGELTRLAKLRRGL